MPIFAVRTTVGREELVLERLAEGARKFGHKLFALILPADVKGYIFVEAPSIDEVRAAARGVNHVRGIVNRVVSIDEIKQFLEAKPVEIKIKRGDIVELVSEPFRGEKAKVTRVDAEKREVTVELIEAAIPIPMTLPIEAVRLIKSGEEA